MNEVDQTAADADQAAAGVDQAAAGVDQAASDGDQAAANRDQTAASPADTAGRQANARSAFVRRSGTDERTASAVLRAQAAQERLDVADRRDEESRLRDLAAASRDRAAAERDHLAAQKDPSGPAAAARAKAANDRALAADDRARAAADREQAALDRQQVREALSQAHLDELTGTYRRGLGTLALQREINRARHSSGQLVLAFVDVDGLKEINDRHGHQAGDALLINVAETIRSKLRSYDPVVRFGGDEFVCAFSDFGLEEARRRFAEIQGALEQRRVGYSISVGFAELRGDDTLDDLVARGDAALYEVKRHKRGSRCAEEKLAPTNS